MQYMDNEGRACSKCRTYKLWDQFNKGDSRGHKSICRQCQKEYSKTYQRDPAKQAQAHKRWYAKDPEKHRQQARQKYQDEASKRKEQQRQYYQANAEKIREASRRRYQAKKQSRLDEN